MNYEKKVHWIPVAKYFGRSIKVTEMSSERGHQTLCNHSISFLIFYVAPCGVFKLFLLFLL